MIGSDTVTPERSLKYAIKGTLPAGARFDSTNRQLDWEVGIDQFSQSVKFEFLVSDASSPPLSDSKSINLTVARIAALPFLENSNGMKLVRVPAGIMYSEPGYKTSGSVTVLRNSKPFLMGTTEVTQRQYERVMDSNPSHFSKNGPGKNLIVGVRTGDLPVESVTWINAAAFCNQLSEKEKLKPYYTIKRQMKSSKPEFAVTENSTNGYRLPSEAEFYFAAFAGEQSVLHLRGDPLLEFAWMKENSNGRTQAVGTKKANPFGIHDLYGNVWEYTGAPGAFNGGCAWGHPVVEAMTKPRRGFNNGVAAAGSDMGFRVVRTE